jgi:hypothetical protein
MATFASIIKLGISRIFNANMWIVTTDTGQGTHVIITQFTIAVLLIIGIYF